MVPETGSAFRLKRTKYVRERMNSFGYAWNGVRILWRQPHAKIHAAATAIVLAWGWYRQLTASNWCILSICIAAVWITEAINTSLEILCDLVHPQYHPMVKNIKDVAAASVLIAAFLSVSISLLILI